MMRFCLLLTFVKCLPAIALATAGHLTLCRDLHAAQPLVLTDVTTEYALSPHIDILTDPTDALTLADVTSPEIASRFVPNQRSTILANRTIWLRLDLANAGSASSWTVIASFAGYPIDAYVQKTGPNDATPLNRVPHRYPAFSLGVEPTESVRLYIRIGYFGGNTSAPITLMESGTFRDHARSDYLIQGLYFGVVGVMVLYNLFLFLSLRDPAYLYYVLMMCVTGLWIGHISGTAGEYLWSDYAAGPGFLTLNFLFVALIWFFSVRFSQVYLATEKQMPRLHRVFWVLAAFHLVFNLGRSAGWVYFRPLIQTYPLVMLATSLLVIATAVIGIRQGYRPATFFLAGFGVYLAASVMVFLALLDILPIISGLPLGNWYQLPHAAEVILFSLGLADRINVLRREKEQQESAAREAERISQETREQSQRKSAFLASMAHELRTPLNAIKGFNSLVIRRAGESLPDQQRDNLTKVDRASDHLLATINDLLDLSKIEAGRMDVNVTTFDVRSVILSACEVVSPLVQDGVELRHDISDEIGEAHTDRQRLSQMLINLLSNAIKFTDQGSVTVTADFDGASLAPPAPGALRISVTDTGRGIPEPELATLFDEYRQVEGQSESTVQRGTGLGLSITKRFAELLGGSISVESIVGQGSTFTITIPSTYAATDQETTR